ncbi:MAG: 3-phosphoserine/phosphohydroxythreonine transaminase [Gammaproteobacteria bacterium]|nr:3-phosphoserine/phosphohydroxythreonine transaminase [Gammaproteobacteria bacterium]
MSKVYNFSAGPGMLPVDVMQQAQAEMLDWHGLGMSIMELGHRGPEFQAVADQAIADLRELMAIPSNYHVLFLAGGASTHFAMVPLNLMGGKKTADYVDTGIWSKKAIAEARRYGNINIAAGLEEERFISIPPQSEWNLNPEAAYLHYTPNETIEGIEFNWVPEVNVPLVADMSSMILSRHINVSDYGIIYAGAQKNMGPAGINVAIIREDLLQEPLLNTPSLYNYKLQCEHHSFYNTPPTYNWYLVGLVLDWMKRKGGVSHFEKINQRKSEKLYQFIDTYAEFYINNVDPSCRSRMNVIFKCKDPVLEPTFLKLATEAGLANLRGHKLLGGMRASIYNAMPEEGVDKLIEFMHEFAKKYG